MYRVFNDEDVISYIKNENDRVCDVFSNINIMVSQLKSLIETMMNIGSADRCNNTFDDLIFIADDICFELSQYSRCCEISCDVKKTIC